MYILTYDDMKKIQCPNLNIGENVHTHYCNCCNGKQHIPFAVALKYQLRGLLVLSDSGNRDASDDEMHERINRYIEYYKNKHGYTGSVEFDQVRNGEPISTLNSCIDTLRFYNS